MQGPVFPKKPCSCTGALVKGTLLGFFWHQLFFSKNLSTVPTSFVLFEDSPPLSHREMLSGKWKVFFMSIIMLCCSLNSLQPTGIYLDVQ